MTIKIRRAEEKDLPVIYAFLCDLENCQFELSVFENIFFTNLMIEKYIYLVAENESATIIGYIGCHGQLLLHHCDWVFEIQELYVGNNFRKLGVGTALINALEKEITNLHHSLIEVTANKTRHGSHKFYVDQGFVETHKKYSKNIIY